METQRYETNLGTTKHADDPNRLFQQVINGYVCNGVIDSSVAKDSLERVMSAWEKEDIKTIALLFKELELMKSNHPAHAMAEGEQLTEGADDISEQEFSLLLQEMLNELPWLFTQAKGLVKVTWLLLKVIAEHPGDVGGLFSEVIYKRRIEEMQLCGSDVRGDSPSYPDNA